MKWNGQVSKHLKYSELPFHFETTETQVKPDLCGETRALHMQLNALLHF